MGEIIHRGYRVESNGALVRIDHRLSRTTPCNKCPWRRSSAQGWLGGYPAKIFVQAILAEHPMSCHIDYENRDGSLLEETPSCVGFCAGALIFMRNIAKLPRDPAMAAATQSVDADRELVFATPNEFIDYHTRAA